MNNHVTFNGVDEAVQGHLKTYWAEKLCRLQKLLALYRTNPREIQLTMV